MSIPLQDNVQKHQQTGKTKLTKSTKCQAKHKTETTVDDTLIVCGGLSRSNSDSNWQVIFFLFYTVLLKVRP
jgi:hypothetical protein